MPTSVLALAAGSSRPPGPCGQQPLGEQRARDGRPDLCFVSVLLTNRLPALQQFLGCSLSSEVLLTCGAAQSHTPHRPPLTAPESRCLSRWVERQPHLLPSSCAFALSTEDRDHGAAGHTWRVAHLHRVFVGNQVKKTLASRESSEAPPPEALETHEPVPGPPNMHLGYMSRLESRAQKQTGLGTEGGERTQGRGGEGLRALDGRDLVLRGQPSPRKTRRYTQGPAMGPRASVGPGSAWTSASSSVPQTLVLPMTHW